jgi:hypothetical protein
MRYDLHEKTGVLIYPYYELDEVSGDFLLYTFSMYKSCIEWLFGLYNIGKTVKFTYENSSGTRRPRPFFRK